MTTVHGTVEPGFEGVRDALANNLATGADVGASACVTVDGHVVADLWGGHLDRDGTKEWNEDTIINVWSTTKTMAALSALILAQPLGAATASGTTNFLFTGGPAPH